MSITEINYLNRLNQLGIEVTFISGLIELFHIDLNLPLVSIEMSEHISYKTGANNQLNDIINAELVDLRDNYEEDDPTHYSKEIQLITKILNG